MPAILYALVIDLRITALASQKKKMLPGISARNAVDSVTHSPLFPREVITSNQASVASMVPATIAVSTIICLRNHAAQAV